MMLEDKPSLEVIKLTDEEKSAFAKKTKLYGRHIKKL